MTKFHKPGVMDYPALTKEAGEQALADAGVEYGEIQQAYVGYVFGDSTCGQRALYQLGMTGIPIVNVSNNCATGSTALMLAWQAVGSGAVECVLALGFEKMAKGSLGATFMDRTIPMDKHIGMMVELRGYESGPPAAQIFGNAGREHMERYGTTPEHFAKIAYKNHLHSTRNPYSQFQDEYSLSLIHI